MEFERALFRIHQRTLHSESLRKARLHAERWLPWVILLFALCLVFVHSTFVGKARCLPIAMRRAGLWNTTLESDVLLSVSVVEQASGDDDELAISLQMAATDSVATRAESRNGAREAQASGDHDINVQAERARVVEQSEGMLQPTQNVIVAYRFTLDREIALLRPALLAKHSFKVHNVTISDRCLAPSRVLRDVLKLFDAFDGIVINELAYTLRSRGYLERMEGDAKVESWAWSADQVESAAPNEGRTLVMALVRKVLVFLKAGITFLLISSITGFFIRVAVNGSAVLMFPIAMILQQVDAERMPLRVLIRSFPWIGVHVEILRRAQRPLAPLFRSHFIFLFIQSFAYLSCNLAWRLILYRKSTPDGFEERVFSFCSVIELFNLIFVRSVSSTSVFPKLATGCMVYLHFYIFSALYPWHMLAFGVCTSTCVYIMIYCLNHFEEPALRADPFLLTTPTAAHPRSLYMPQLSPSWTTESAPMWTMFYPPEQPHTYPDEALRPMQNEEYQMA